MISKQTRVLVFYVVLMGWAGLSGGLPASDAPPFHKGSETLVVLPDTEVYANKKPALFKAQMEWIRDNLKARNIACVMHVGDVTNNNTRREWRVARECFDLIEGKVPYVLATGNHDYDHTPGRLTLMNEVFKVEDLRKGDAFGDVFEPGKLENHYQFVNIHGRKWLILSLEMGPRNGVIDWAGKVLAKHPGHLAIILTHAYLYYGNARYNHKLGGQRASPHGFYGEGADGEMLWNKLVRKHANVMLVVCGHLSSGYVGYRADEGDYGNTVHQMMCDYEKMKSGGMGFLRLLEFLPDRKTVQVRTYSPVTQGKNPRDAELEEFTFALKLKTRDKPKPASGLPSAPLSKPPVHRYSFSGRGANRAKLADSAGRAHGIIRAEDGDTALDGEGALVLSDNGHAQFPAGLLKRFTDVSFELWFTPMADSYKWHSVVRFGCRDDWFTYVFRSLTVHRAEIAVGRHNEDIQKKGVPAEKGKAMHVVVTYDRDGNDGKPLLGYYRDGKRIATMGTGLLLSDVKDTMNVLGPFAGRFDEFRIYAHPLSAEEVQGSYVAGPDRVEVK